MSYFVPNVTRVFQLDNWLVPGFGDILLFKNSLSPDRDTVLGDLTECDFSGYSRQSPASWSAATITVDNYATTVGDDVSFDHDGGATANDVYGAALLDTGGGLIGLSIFAGGPFTMSASGDNITVSPTYKHGSIDDN